MLVRKGAENRASEGADFDQLLANRPSGDFETQSVAGATREDLDENIIENYLERRQKRNPRSSPLPKDKLLQQISALTDDKMPTVSGLLLFGREPQLFMPHSRVIFVKFADTSPRGEGGSFGYGRREELIGPLPVIIDRAWRVIWEEMDKRAVVRGLIREEQLEYPEFAVREALVNAVAHRDYRLTGRSIEIRMYTDRLEVTSPGGLPAHITIDNIVEEHYSRNPRVVNGLYQWGYIEELGLGVDRMIEDMVNAGHAPPKFEAKEHRVSVVLYNKRENLPAAPSAGPVNIASNVTVNPQAAPPLTPPVTVSGETNPTALRPQSWESNMTERQAKALEFLQHKGAITNSDYRALCPHVGPETLRLDLADLVERGVLLKIGDKRGTRYILK